MFLVAATHLHLVRTLYLTHIYLTCSVPRKVRQRSFCLCNNSRYGLSHEVEAHIQHLWFKIMFCFNSNATFFFFCSVFCLSVLPEEAIKPRCLIETHSQSPQDINSNEYNADAAGNLNQLFPKHFNLLLPLKQNVMTTLQHSHIWKCGYSLTLCYPHPAA